MAVGTDMLLSQRPTAATLLADVKGGDATLRLRAVEQAPLVGTPVIVPLGRVMAAGDRAAARTAVEALRRVAHHCARPGAGAERATAAKELLKLTTASLPTAVRVEALYLLGFLAAARDAAALGALLNDPSVREEALLALERVPGAAVDRVLRTRLARAAPEFQAAIRLTLEARRKRVGSSVK
jgi:hydrogenase maturation factor